MKISICQNSCNTDHKSWPMVISTKGVVNSFALGWACCGCNKCTDVIELWRTNVEKLKT